MGYKGRVAGLANQIDDTALRQVFNAIGLQLDELYNKLDDLEEDVRKLKKEVKDLK